MLLTEYLQSLEGVQEYTLISRFGYDEVEKVEVDEGRAQTDFANYSGKVEVFEFQDNQELKTFMGIFLFTGIFGILLLLFLKRLKRLTHGAEDLKAKS